MIIRKMLRMKDDIDAAVEENKKSIERAEKEVKEREAIDSRLKGIQIELDNMVRNK